MQTCSYLLDSCLVPSSCITKIITQNVQAQNQQAPPTNDRCKLEETKSTIAVHVLIYHFKQSVHGLEEAKPKKK